MCLLQMSSTVRNDIRLTVTSSHMLRSRLFRCSPNFMGCIAKRDKDNKLTPKQEQNVLLAQTHLNEKSVLYVLFIFIMEIKQQVTVCIASGSMSCLLGHLICTHQKLNAATGLFLFVFFSPSWMHC